MLIDATLLLLFPVHAILKPALSALPSALVSKCCWRRVNSEEQWKGESAYLLLAGITKVLTTVRISQVYLSWMNTRAAAVLSESQLADWTVVTGHLPLDCASMNYKLLYFYSFLPLAHSSLNSTKHVYIYLFIFIVIFAIFVHFCALYLNVLCCQVTIKSNAFPYKNVCLLGCFILFHIRITTG